MSNIDHIVLYLFLFLFMHFWGKENYAKKTWEFWLCAIVPILCFAIITGCRTWGVDYDWYKYKMCHPEEFRVKKDEFLFLRLNDLIRFLKMDGEAGFIVYSIIIITGAFIFIRSFKGCSKYMYVLFVPAILLETMGHIRQGVAFGVSMIALNFLNEKKWWSFILFSLIAFNIHHISILLSVTCFVLYVFRNNIIPPRISVPAYCIGIFSPKYIDYAIIQKILNFIPVEGSKYTGYIKNMSVWFSHKANHFEWTQSSLAMALSALFDISIILLSYRYLKKICNHSIIIYYNLFVLGAILVRLFFFNEILRRTFLLYYMLYFVPLGFCFYIYNIIDMPFTQKRTDLSMVCILCIMVYLVLFWGRFIFLNEESQFIWG